MSSRNRKRFPNLGDFNIRSDHKPRQAVASMPVLAQESFLLGPKTFFKSRIDYGSSVI